MRGTGLFNFDFLNGLCFDAKARLRHILILSLSFVILVLLFAFVLLTHPIKI